MIKIAIVGFGKIGLDFFNFFQHINNLQVVCIVEKNKIVDKTGKIPIYTSLERLLHHDVNVVIDCCTEGEGVKNLSFYKKHGLKAVFQSGESSDICDMIYSPFIGEVSQSSASYLRVPKCSAIMLMDVLLALRNGGLGVSSASASYYKAMSGSKLELNYSAGREVESLFSMEENAVNIDVVYLKVPQTIGYRYYANLSLNTDTLLTDKQAIIFFQDAESSNLISLIPNISEHIEERSVLTTVVRESVKVRKRELSLVITASIPEILLKHVISAIAILGRNS